MPAFLFQLTAVFLCSLLRSGPLPALQLSENMKSCLSRVDVSILIQYSSLPLLVFAVMVAACSHKAFDVTTVNLMGEREGKGTVI